MTELDNSKVVHLVEARAASGNLRLLRPAVANRKSLRHDAQMVESNREV